MAMIVPTKMPPTAKGTMIFDKAISTISGVPAKMVKKIRAKT